MTERRKTRRGSESEPAMYDEVIRRAGGDPESMSGKLVREILHTGAKLVRDGADIGELKLVSRSLKELRYALKIFRDYREVPKVTIFGSARTPEDHPDFKAAVGFSEAMSRSGWMVITGAGDGIMLAGHQGAGRQASFGVAIRLPFETNANRVIEGDTKLVTFRYFFTRKLIFVSQAHAVVLFPGGFGTQDEGFEVLTLVQTGKAPMIPLVMIDPPGGVYWQQWDEYVRDHLLAAGLISPEDLNLYFVTDDYDQAVQHIRTFYSNYHSQRMVRDHMVIRMRHRLTDAAVDALNDEFSDIVADGKIEQGGPFDVEQEYEDLPRLRFVFCKGRYGRLRLLIDRLNSLAPQPAERGASEAEQEGVPAAMAKKRPEIH